MPKKLINLISIAIMLGMTVTATAQTQWILVTHENYPPYNFKGPGGTPSGLDTELVAAVMDYLGQAYAIRFVPWKRVVQMVEQNAADLAFQFKATQARRNQYLLVGPLRTGKTVFAARKDAGMPDYKDLRDYEGYTIGMNLGYSYGDTFDHADFLKKDAGARTNAQLIRKLMKNRVDIIIGDQHTLVYAAKKEGVYGRIRFLGIYQAFPRYVAVPRERADRAGLFDHGLNAIQDSGLYDRIMKKWQ